MRVRFASPENLDALEREGVAIGRVAREAAEAYGAHSIELIISANFETRTATLGSRAAGAVRRIFRHGNVSHLEVKTLDDDGVEDVDLLDERLKCDEVLDLPEGNPEAHYNARRAWLEEKFNGMLPVIRQMQQRA